MNKITLCSVPYIHRELKLALVPTASFDLAKVLDNCNYRTIAATQGRVYLVSYKDIARGTSLESTIAWI